jgi:hypothetical protein
MASKTVAADNPQSDRMRRVGTLVPGVQGDSEPKARAAAFLGAMRRLSWTEEQNLRIDICWSAADLDRIEQLGVDAILLNWPIHVVSSPLATLVTLDVADRRPLA